MASLSELTESFTKVNEVYEARISSLKKCYAEDSLESSNLREQLNLILLDVMLDLTNLQKVRLNTRASVYDKILDSQYYYLRDLNSIIRNLIELIL